MLRNTLVGAVILIALGVAVLSKVKRTVIELEPAIAAEQIALPDPLHVHLQMGPYGVPTEDLPGP
jgi:cell division septation protein DedD